MTIFLDAQETADRFGIYIQELRAIMRANHIRFGLPDNFFAFARRLQSDDLLPVDLCRMVKFIIERESSEISLNTTLTMIAIASGGSAIAEANRDLTEPVNIVIDFLIRTGLFGTADPEPLDAPCTSPFTTTTNIEKGISETETGFSAPIDFLASDQPANQTDTSNIPWPSSDSDSLPAIDRPSKLLQSLTRLEHDAQKVEFHLESIEQRINTIEPKLEDVPLFVSPPPNQSPTSSTESLYRADSPVKPSSIPAHPPLPSFVRRPSGPSKEHLAWFFLLGDKLAVVPVLATIAGGTLLYIGFQRNSAKTGMNPTVPASVTSVNRTASTGDMEIVVTPQPASTSAPTEVAVKPQPPKPSAASPAVNTPASKAIKKHSARTPKPIEPPPDRAAKRSALSPHLETTKLPQSHGTSEVFAKTGRDVGYIPARASAKSAPSSLRTVNVSSGVMAANLISASPPSYPRLAGLTHMQGKVVMQAVISKDGTVQNLHVIQGHLLLRHAAKSSARTWRYRPYLVNGKPVEVATIVSIDFALPH